MSFKKPRILFIDDDEMITDLYRLVFDRSGEFEVRTENSGTVAVQVAREFQPDLVFLDWNMPDRSGPDVAADLLGAGELCGIKVAYMTGSAAATGTYHGLPSFPKPVCIEQFIVTARGLLASAN